MEKSKTKQMTTEFQVNGLTLVGNLHLPAAPNAPLVVGSHGLEGTRNSAKQQVLARLLPENGMAFFRFDHRGCGQSQGVFAQETSLEKRSQDLVAAASHALGLGLTAKRLALFGSSMGGASCIHAWPSLEDLGLSPMGAVLCAAPIRSRTICNIPTRANGSRPALPISFFAKNLLFDIRERAIALHHILVFHGDQDEVVPVSNAHDLYQAASSPKKRIIQAGGDHQMTSKSDRAEFEAQAVAWYRSILLDPGSPA